VRSGRRDGAVATRADDGPAQVVIGAVLPLTGEESRVGGYFKLAYELRLRKSTTRAVWSFVLITDGFRSS